MVKKQANPGEVLHLSDLAHSCAFCKASNLISGSCQNQELVNGSSFFVRNCYSERTFVIFA